MSQPTVTQSLARWSAGDHSDEPALMGVVYPMLRAIAQKQLAATGPITMQATELANEAFIRLRATRELELGCRFQFMGFVAKVMRNLIVDHLREQHTQKRGGEFSRIDLAELNQTADGSDIERQIDWLALDAGLLVLQREEPDHVHLVELRYFMGMSIEQAAEQLGVSTATANRMWRFARAFLLKWMHRTPTQGRAG